MKSGIYIITNLLDNKVYIGRSKDWKMRLSYHKNHLKKNKHANIHLQRAYNRDSVENFTFELLEEHEEEFLCSMENWWCNMLNSHNRDYGYNIEPTSPFGRLTISEETRKKSSESHKGRTNSEEVRKKLSKALKGRKLTKEHIEKITKANIGKKIPEWQVLLLKNVNTGLKRTQEVKNKMSKTRYKPVVQLSKEGKFIKFWKNMTEPSEKLNINRDYIGKAISNKIKLAGGFQWITRKDYLNGFSIISNQLAKKLKKEKEIQGL